MSGLTKTARMIGGSNSGAPNQEGSLSGMIRRAQRRQYGGVNNDPGDKGGSRPQGPLSSVSGMARRKKKSKVGTLLTVKPGKDDPKKGDTLGYGTN